MTLTIQLPPLLEAQVVKAATESGLATDAYVVQMLETTLAKEAAARLQAMFEKWNEENKDEPDDGYDLLQALDANRAPGERPLFPPEMKGISW